MRWRYPDKPLEINSLSICRDGEYLAQSKHDGWRCLIVMNEHDDIEFWSRQQKKLPVSFDFTTAIANLPIPSGSVLDGEWMKRRPNYTGPEMIYLFGVLWWGDKWMGRLPEIERWEMVQEIMRHNRSPLLRLPQTTTSGYEAFFEQTKKDPSSEGIVLKKLDSKLLGNLTDSKQNPLWYKYKWRSGADGWTIKQ